MKNFKVVGKPLPRLDGPESVTGRAIYTVDVALPEMLHIKLFRSDLPHAKIRRLDVSRARALNGVAAVLTADDVPAKRFGFGVQDEQLLERPEGLAHRLRALDDEPALGHAGRAPVQASYCLDPGVPGRRDHAWGVKQPGC